jgi:ankyrin
MLRFGKKKVDTHELAKEGKAVELFTELSVNRKRVNERNSEGLTVLHVACEYCHQDIVGNLLKFYSSNVGAVTLAGATPLHIACADTKNKSPENEISVPQLLIQHGAKIDEKDKHGNTPLHTACYWGKNDVVELLLDKGSKIETLNKLKRSALYVACYRGRVKTAKVLIDRGADMRAAGDDGNTPLHGSCIRGHKDVVKLLISHGASTSLKNRIGKTPLDCCYDEDLREDVQVRDVTQSSTSYIYALSHHCLFID